MAAQSRSIHSRASSPKSGLSCRALLRPSEVGPIVRANGSSSLLDSLIGLIPAYGPWVIFGVVALESAGVPLPGETNLVGAALLASSTDQISIITVVVAAAVGAIVGDSTGY